jgi:hypothetical protein
MAQAEVKTTKNNASVKDFLASIPDDQKREDSIAIVKLMSAITGEKPHMWGTNMIGFGSRHFVYASGREADWGLLGFAPRKDRLTIYTWGLEAHQELLDKIGKYKAGKSCLHIKRLSDINLDVLKELIHDAAIVAREGEGIHLMSRKEKDSNGNRRTKNKKD